MYSKLHMVFRVNLVRPEVWSYKWPGGRMATELLHLHNSRGWSGAIGEYGKYSYFCISINLPRISPVTLWVCHLNCAQSKEWLVVELDWEEKSSYVMAKSAFPVARTLLKDSICYWFPSTDNTSVLRSTLGWRWWEWILDGYNEERCLCWSQRGDQQSWLTSSEALPIHPLNKAQITIAGLVGGASEQDQAAFPKEPETSLAKCTLGLWDYTTPEHQTASEVRRWGRRKWCG